MATKKTRLSTGGDSYAVKMLRKFQLKDITQMIHPRKLSWAPLMDSLKKFSTDYMAQGRRQPRQRAHSR